MPIGLGSSDSSNSDYDSGSDSGSSYDYNRSSYVSDPGVCNCTNNLNAGTYYFDSDILQRRCEDYTATLTQSQKTQRAYKAFDCM